MSTANASPSPGAVINISDRDHVADSDDSLARKRQRLSEELEVRIEADEPEDLGDDLHNAIMIEDDPEGDDYSNTFQLSQTNLSISVMDELKQLQRLVTGDHFFDLKIVNDVALWINQHLADTAHDQLHWHVKYLKDELFFTELATFAHCILDCHDLFDAALPSVQIQQVCPKFCTALTQLCLRVVSLIPKILEEPFTRRDSVQPAAVGLILPLSTYISLLWKVLDENAPFLNMLQRHFGVKLVQTVNKSAKLVLGQRPAIPSLNKILLNLGMQPRSFTNAWPVIADILNILTMVLKSADSDYHAGPGWEHVDNMLTAIDEYVVPAICQKHPRALPPNFHDNLIGHVSAVLEISVKHRPMSSVLELYNAITHVDNALACGLVDEPATELKLKQACSDDRPVLAELLRDLWLLQVLKGYVSTDILDIKSRGILSLRVLLKDSYHLHHKDGGDEDTILQYLARFLRIGNFTEYIFSADSHASLVKECSDVVGFLAAIGTYTNHETDLIWHAGTTSVEAEFVKASFEVLRYILRFLSPLQALHVARKYSQTPASALGSFAVHFLSEVLAHFHGLNQNANLSLEPMRISFDIIERLDLDPPAPSASSLRITAIGEIALLADSAYSIDERKILYDMCLCEIFGRTKHATSSTEILVLFLRYPEAEEIDLILDMYPVRAAVDELEHFASSEVKDLENGVHSFLEAVKIRLELVLYLVGLMDYSEDKDLEERLWTCTIGDAAISSQAREDALDCFIAIPQRTKNPPSVEQLFHRGVDQFLPTMSADCATLRLIAFLRGKVKEAELAATANNIGLVLGNQSWQQLLRLTLTTSSDHVAAAGISAILEVLFPKDLSRDNPQVMALQAAFVRTHIDFLQTLQEKQDCALRQITMDRAITLLETIHSHSKSFKPQIIGGVSPIELSGDEEADRIEFTVHIHGPQGTPIARTVQALEDCHIVDLGKALQSTSGVTDHDLVLNGSLSRIEDISGQTLHQAGIRASSVVSIRPRYTFDCDFGKVFPSTSPIEGETRAKFSQLESLLDGPELVAERVYCFLSEVSPPMSTRHRVLSREVSLEEIFPRDRPWRTLFSIHVLSSHLHECNKLGVADKGFILHGSKVLSDLLLDSSRPVSGVILRKCLPSLVGFLQGETQQPKTSTSLHLANDLLERPHDSPPPPYIEDSARLGFRLFEIIEEIDSFTPSTPMLSSQPVAVSCRAELKKLTYSVMLQLARTDGLWPAIENTSFFVSAHRGMLLNEDASVSQTMSSFMTDFLKEQPKLATRSYLRTLLALMPDAMGCQRSTAGFFTLFREVLLVNGRAGDSDQNIRSIIEKLVQHVWLYQHTETADNAVVDPTLLNLLNLLNSAIDVLRSFKQPLALGSLAMDIYSGLLFCDESQSPEADLLTTDIDESAKPSLTLRANPIHADDATSLLEPADTILPHHLSPLGSSRPLYNTISRTVCMEIVRKLCDNSVTLAWLTDCLSSVTQQAAQCPVNAFPTGHFIRAPDAGAGLTNLGMTCYMNSLLQQIYANIQLRKFVFDTPVANPSEPDLLWHVKRLFAEMQDSNTPCVDTQALARYLNISVENQEDVHGFYTIFMSALEQCLPNPAATAAFNSMFSGKLVTQIQGSCGHVSSRTEPFSDLSITVQNKTSLAESLEEFVQGEPMQGANKYKCLSCDAESGGKLVDAMRRTCLDTVPDHLTVCLKRFTFDMLGQESKNNDYFQFPEEFDLSEFKRESLEHPDKPAQPDMFKLVGVIVHSGILTFGHYWSYVRLRYPDHHFSRWARLEDSNYRSAQGFDEVQNECYGGAKGTHNGYVLFYQRESAFDMARSATLPQNAQSSYNMPPRVQVPNDLYQEIHQQNVERHRTAQPFDESFHKLVLDVIQEFHLRSADAIEDITSPQSPDVTSPDMNQMAMMHSHASVARLGLNYINHVLFSEKIPGKVRQFDNAFIQVVRNVMSARFFIMEASRNPGVLLRLIDHDELASRNIIKTLFRRCLEIIREGDPDKYDFYFKQFVNAHASMLSEMGPRYYRWLDYFAMAFDLKMLGRFEATVVLNAGYIPWILETAMDAPLDPSAHPDQQALVTAWRKGRVSYLPLLQFLQLFMVQGGAFNEPDSYDTFRDHGEFAAAMGLFEHKAPGECALLRWMLIASMSETDASTWRSFAPAVLVQAMAESPDERVSTIVGNSLWACFNQNQVFKPALSLMAIAYIIGCKDKNLDMVQTVLEAMFECIRLSKRMPCRAGLDILDAVMPWAPISTLYSIDYCLPEFLLPGNKVTKRTHQWLTLNVFAPDPLSKVSEEPEIWGTALDVARAQSVRGLYRTCNEFLINAHDVDDTPVYHVMQTTFSDAANYLARLITMCSEVEHTSLGLRQLAERGVRDRADAEGEATDMTTPGTLDIPELSEEMAKEYPLALDTRQRLLALLQTMQRWADDQELMEEEDSSAFDDTEDDEV